MIGYGIIIPILYGYSKKFGLSDFDNGLLFALFSICQFIATPIIGRLSDKYGRRPMLLVSISGTAVSFFMMAFAPSSIVLFLSRALDGITAGNIPVAFAVISDSTESKDRARAFGIIGSALSLGFVMGPALAAFTVDFGQAVPFIAAGIITTLAVILTALYLPETNKHMGEVKHGKLFDFPRMWRTLFDPNLGSTFVVSLIFFMAFACAIIYGFQPFTQHILRISASQNALLFTMFGLVGLLTQTILVAPFSKFFGLKRAFTHSLSFVVLSFILMFFSSKLPLFIIAAIVLAISNSLVQTLIPTILSQETDPKSQGTVMGLNASYQSIGMIIGPILGGIVATISIPFTFLTGAILVSICYVISFRVFKPEVPKQSAF